MIKQLLVVVAALILTLNQVNGLYSSGPPLETKKQWNLLAYNLPWDFPANDKEFYDPENVIATGLAVDRDRIFISTPRLFSGIPATVSFIPKKDSGDSPILQAYPNWSYHTAGTKQYNCTDLGLVSVYRMRMDTCNRLWTLDAGVSRSIEDFEVTCPPKILVINTETDQVVRRIDFPREVIRGESLFTNMIIDGTSSHPENHCDDVFIYISDTVEPAIIVYDSGRDLTWRLSHPSMYPDPNFAQSNILGHRFTLMDGIVGLAFDAVAGVVYFQPLATDRLFSIATSALRAGPLPFGAELPVKLVGKKSSQGIGLAVLPIDGSILFSPMSETAIAKWTPGSNKQEVLAFDKEQLQFVADIRIPAKEPGTAYILSSRFHRFFLRNLDSTEVNTRILVIDGLSTAPAAAAAAPPIFGNAINYGLHHQSPQNHQHYTGAPSAQIFSHQTTKQPIFLNSLRQPYQYESVGIINKINPNPFATLNTGEKPNIFRQSTPLPNAHHKSSSNYISIGPSAYGHQHGNLLPGNEHFNGYSNSLRYVRGTAYNTSVVHSNKDSSSN